MPNLSARIGSKNSGLQTVGSPSLLILQQDASMEKVFDEMHVVCQHSGENPHLSEGDTRCRSRVRESRPTPRGSGSRQQNLSPELKPDS